MSPLLASVRFRNTKDVFHLQLFVNVGGKSMVKVCSLLYLLSI